MAWVAGADGCKGGWFRVSRETSTGELRFHLVERAEELLSASPRAIVVGLDIPIGLSDSGPRECDRRARECLGWPRRTSVFPAPIRPALRATTREEAAWITQGRDGRRVGAQGWALYEKIREVDDLLQASADARERIREVHPELSFRAWSGGQAIAAGKKTAAGRERRRHLVEEWLGPAALATARGRRLRRQLADDDILDAVAALWTATRIVGGVAKTLPEEPPRDATGLSMEIVY